MIFPQRLVPAIVQNALSGDILMVAYMNQEAYALTLTTGAVHFYSRSRQSLWRKGATSGHTLKLQELTWDCDNDAILVKVVPSGPVCHTGEKSCFHNIAYTGPKPPPMDILSKLAIRLTTKMHSQATGSYSTTLMTGALSQCAKKVVEEAGELVIAAVADSQERVVSESADLLFHLVALLTRREVPLERVLVELTERWKNE